jgi:GAF domain-containing protein
MPASDLPPGPDQTSSDLTERRLLASVVEVARRVFSAAAASIFLVDEHSGELVFEAVSGEGERWLPGTRFPAGTGIAGWVALSGQPVLADDVSEASHFAREAAESTGYVPRSIMAAPLIRNGDCAGVLEILDRGSRDRGELQDVDLLALLATQAAIGLELFVRSQWADGADAGHGGDTPPELLRRIAARLPLTPEPIAATVVKLLATADDLLSGQDDPNPLVGKHMGTRR